MAAVLAVAAPPLLGGCDPAQLARIESYQQKIAAACNMAMTVAPLAGPVAPYIIGGCATEQAIAKLALDPSSLEWVRGLIAGVAQ